MYSCLLVVIFGSVLCVEVTAQDSDTGSEPLRRALARYDAHQLPQRIIGGGDATIKDNPWQVAFLATRIPLNTQAQFCGGSIVSKRWVLTAAHCVEHTRTDQIQILAGTATLLSGNPRLTVDKIIVDPNWKPSTHEADFAIVHVTKDLNGQAIEAIDDSESGLVDGMDVKVSGWGLVNWQNRAGTNVLEEMIVPYVINETCNLAASYDNHISPSMLCAGANGRDSCKGDSGGPASILVAGKRKLVGVVSWGFGCGLANKFGVYARVSKIRVWARTESANEINW
jgi:secreted trypsin-like serine protease